MEERSSQKEKRRRQAAGENSECTHVPLAAAASATPRFAGAIMGGLDPARIHTILEVWWVAKTGACARCHE